MNHEQSPPATGVVGWLAANHRRGAGLFLAAGLMTFLAAGVLFWQVQLTSEKQMVVNDPLVATSIWMAALAIAMLVGGAILNADRAGRYEELVNRTPLNELVGQGSARESVANAIATQKVRTARIVLLAIAGLAGAATFLFGLTLLYLWGDAVTKLLRSGEREGGWRILLGLTTVIGGLGVMFAGVQSARAGERSDVGIRRAVYGFNAFLTGFLLISVLLVINVLVYLKLPGILDTTSTGIHSLAPKTVEVLRELDKSVHVYVNLDPQDAIGGDLRAMLTMAKTTAADDMFDFTMVSQLEEAPYREKLEKFPQLVDEGMLIVYGSDKKNTTAFVARRSLTEEGSNVVSGEAPKRSFMGEVRLVNELLYLMSGKDEPVIYFTQGHGEAPISDTRTPLGLGLLTRQLEQRRFIVKPLELSADASARVPDDAKLIVIANPKQPYGASAVAALRDFLSKQRGGRLVGLFDAKPATPKGRDVPVTGFESLLRDYGVDLTRQMLLTAVPPELRHRMTVLSVVAHIDEAAKSTPLGRAFANDTLELRLCRVIQPLTEKRPQAPFQATTLLTSHPEILPVFSETDLGIDFQHRAQEVIEQAANKRGPFPAVPVAVTVSDADAKPVMAIIGDATFVSNLVLSQSANASESDLFVGAIDWLRERPATPDVKPREASAFHLNREILPRAGQFRFVPLLVSLLGIVGLGVGVWLVRRQ